MQVLCLIGYTDPDGERYEAEQLYQVEPEVAIWLTMAAEGQFKVIEDASTGSAHRPEHAEGDGAGWSDGGGADGSSAAGIGGDGAADRAGEQPPVDRMVRSAPRLRQAQPPARARGRGWPRNSSDTRQE